MGKAQGLPNDVLERSAPVDSIWSVPRPQIEALALFKMLARNGGDRESLRELIEIPEKTDRILRAFVAECPDSKTRVERLLRFRKRVREEFEKLIQAPGPVGATPCPRNATVTSTSV